MKNTALLISIILALASGAPFAQTTEFAYQGNLKNGANPASGNYDFEFSLFDAVTTAARNNRHKSKDSKQLDERKEIIKKQQAELDVIKDSYLLTKPGG